VKTERVPLSVINDRPRTRTCGGCTACCTVVAVEELGKPYHCGCVHQGTQRCWIYDHRPESCRLYECLWLAGMGAAEDRPDQSHLLWGVRVDQGEIYLDCHELRPGIIKNMKHEDFQHLIDAAAATLPNWVWEHDIYGGVCLFPFGLPVGAAFAARPPYPPDPWAGASGMCLKHQGNGVYLYLGPGDAAGLPALFGGDVSRAEQECRRKIEEESFPHT